MTGLLLIWILFGQTTPSEPQIVKTFYLLDNTSSQRHTEIVTTLRQQLNLRYLIPNTGVNGITVRETPERIGQVESLLKSELRGSSAAVVVDSDGSPDEVHKVQTFYLADSSTQRDLVEIVTALRALLNVRYVASNKNAKAITVRDTSSRIAAVAKVIADLNSSQPGAGVQASAAIDAGKEAEVGKKDAVGSERQISLRNVQTEEGVREIVAALRTLLNNAQVEATGNTIVLRDTQNNLFVAERIVADLDKASRK